jgi:hypothetical protein
MSTRQASMGPSISNREPNDLSPQSAVASPEAQKPLSRPLAITKDSRQRGVDTIARYNPAVLIVADSKRKTAGMALPPPSFCAPATTLTDMVLPHEVAGWVWIGVALFFGFKFIRAVWRSAVAAVRHEGMEQRAYDAEGRLEVALGNLADLKRISPPAAVLAPPSFPAGSYKVQIGNIAWVQDVGVSPADIVDAIDRLTASGRFTAGIGAALKAHEAGLHGAQGLRTICDIASEVATVKIVEDEVREEALLLAK